MNGVAVGRETGGGTGIVSQEFGGRLRPLSLAQKLASVFSFGSKSGAVRKDGGQGRVLLKSHERSCDLRVNGEHRASLSAGEEYWLTLPPGQHEIYAITSDEAQCWSSQVAVTDGSSSRLTIELRPNWALLLPAAHDGRSVCRLKRPDSWWDEEGNLSDETLQAGISLTVLDPRPYCFDSMQGKCEPGGPDAMYVKIQVKGQAGFLPFNVLQIPPPRS